MTEIVNDFLLVFSAGVDKGVGTLQDDYEKVAEADKQRDNVMEKYVDVPFAPEQLEELGWEQVNGGWYEKGEFAIFLIRDKAHIQKESQSLYWASIPSTHAELLTLLKLVCGEGK